MPGVTVAGRQSSGPPICYYGGAPSPVRLRYYVITIMGASSLSGEIGRAAITPIPPSRSHPFHFFLFSWGDQRQSGKLRIRFSCPSRATGRETALATQMALPKAHITLLSIVSLSHAMPSELTGQVSSSVIHVERGGRGGAAVIGWASRATRKGHTSSSR